MWVALMIAVQVAAPATEVLADPVTGYRLTRYRGVVPAPPPGVRRIDTGEARRLHRANAATFIDVTPAEGGRRDPATGRWRLAIAHRTLPGAAWFPESGRGLPEPAIARWFAAGVAARAGRRPLVVYCLSDCWMSWNAALRLRRAGYRDVRWFADGVDGWRAAGLPMAIAVPVPGATGQ